MVKDNGKHSKTHIWYLTALALIISAILMAAVTYARYRSVYNSAGTIELKYDFSNTGIYLLAPALDEEGGLMQTPALNADEDAYLKPGDWTLSSDNNDEYSLAFLLSNEDAPDSPASFDQNGYLQVFITEGLVSSDNISISLECEGVLYTATAAEVVEGSSMYRAYGSGWVYRFYGSDEESCWLLKGNVSTAIPMTLTVSGSPEYPAAVTLIASSRPV